MDELKELRNEIDEIDEQLIPLLLKRMDIAKSVAEYKIQHNMPVLNTKREQEILEDVEKKSGEHANSVKTVFSAAMDASRAIQHKIIGGGEELRAAVENAENDSDEITKAPVDFSISSFIETKSMLALSRARSSTTRRSLSAYSLRRLVVSTYIL